MGAALDAASRGLSVDTDRSRGPRLRDQPFQLEARARAALRYLATGDVATARGERTRAPSPHDHDRPASDPPARAAPALLPRRDVPAAHRGRRRHGNGRSAPDAGTHTPLGAACPYPRDGTHGPSGSCPLSIVMVCAGGMLSYDGQLVDDARLVATVAARRGPRRPHTHAGSSHDPARSRCRRRRDHHGRAVRDPRPCRRQRDGCLGRRARRGDRRASEPGNPYRARCRRPRISSTALTIPHEGSISRYVFALPQAYGRVIVGLTDEDSPGAVPESLNRPSRRSTSC